MKAFIGVLTAIFIVGYGTVTLAAETTCVTVQAVGRVHLYAPQELSITKIDTTDFLKSSSLRKSPAGGAAWVFDDFGGVGAYMTFALPVFQGEGEHGGNAGPVRRYTTEDRNNRFVIDIYQPGADKPETEKIKIFVFAETKKTQLPVGNLVLECPQR